MEHPGVAQLEELLSQAGAPAVSGKEKSIRKATRAAEYLTKDLIRPRKIKTELMLGREPFPLDHHPIRNVSVNGIEIDFIAEAGTLLPELPLNSYIVSYDVGYEGDQVPAIVGSLILNLAAYDLTREEEFSTAALAEAETIRTHRRRLTRERHHGQAY